MTACNQIDSAVSSSRNSDAVASSTNKEEKKKRQTSLDIFMTHVKQKENGDYDISGIFSRDCYEKWILTKCIRNPSDGPKRFKDTVKCIITGRNRCKPFPMPVEKEILAFIKKPGVWPCFAHLDKVTIGKNGVVCKGYHEEMAEAEFLHQQNTMCEKQDIACELKRKREAQFYGSGYEKCLESGSEPSSPKDFKMQRHDGDEEDAGTFTYLETHEHDLDLRIPLPYSWIYSQTGTSIYDNLQDSTFSADEYAAFFSR